MASGRTVGAHCAWGDEDVAWDVGNQTNGQEELGQIGEQITE